MVNITTSELHKYLGSPKFLPEEEREKDESTHEAENGRCARGIPARVSPSAGTYVCNHVFYGLMHELTGREHGGARLRPDRRAVRGGFIHVPPLSEPGTTRRGAARTDAGPTGLPLGLMVEALAVAVRESLRRRSGTK